MNFPSLRLEPRDPKTPGIPPILRVGRSDPFYLEQFKALRAKFEYLVDQRKMKVIAITSSIAGEGKTLSCATLAYNLAGSGRKRVLLIDADMRKSDLARGLDIAPVPGLSEFLKDAAEPKTIIRNTLVPGLYVIPGGRTLEDPSKLLSAEKIRVFLEKVQDHYDLILLDTPPIIPVADTLSLRDMVDGFVFLFRAGFTPYPMLQQSLEELGDAKVLGIILNGVEPRRQRYYQRYYGKYYREPPKENGLL